MVHKDVLCGLGTGSWKSSTAPANVGVGCKHRRLAIVVTPRFIVSSVPYLVELAQSLPLAMCS
jgi:hypothetical protein